MFTFSRWDFKKENHFEFIKKLFVTNIKYIKMRSGEESWCRWCTCGSMEMSGRQGRTRSEKKSCCDVGFGQKDRRGQSWRCKGFPWEWEGWTGLETSPWEGQRDGLDVQTRESGCVGERRVKLELPGRRKRGRPQRWFMDAVRYYIFKWKGHLLVTRRFMTRARAAWQVDGHLKPGEFSQTVTTGF